MAGYSLHIGLNRVSAGHYGSEMPLRSAVADAEAMEAIARAQGFSSQALHDDAATSGAVARHIHQLASRARRKDIVLISYAGHGSNIYDSGGDEPDSLDETWCLFDRMMVDDELYGLYTLFGPDVRLLIVSDSCHSGTVARMVSASAAADPFAADSDEVFRTIDPVAARAVYADHSELYDSVQALAAAGGRSSLSCSLQLFAACQDDQLAGDGPDNGYFTSHLLDQWDQGAWQGSYTELYENLRQAMPRKQQPNRQLLGRENAAFLAQRPFTI
ncbi:caspase family protein [Qipengyuania sp.]|uniref:caspase family protein n=1 Tax=Qipengyuania sp. TaxID=2004515 RepID=UPI003516325C